MTPSDWITITMTLVAVLVGCGVSWAFFRTQLVADFKQILAKLSSLESKHDVMVSKVDAIESFKDATDLVEIKKTVDNIDRSLHTSVTSIISDVRMQQQELALRIQAEFDKQTVSSVDVVAQSFKNEIGRFVEDTNKQELLLTKLVQSFMDGLKAMGDYQRVSISDQSSTSLEAIEQSIKGSIDDVLDEVVELREQVLSLPPPSEE